MNPLNNNNNNLYKSNLEFSQELRRCNMILDIFFTKDIENKVLINKNDIINLRDNFIKQKEIDQEIEQKREDIKSK